MIRAGVAGALAALLAGCGSPGTSVTQDGNGSVNVTTPGATVTVNGGATCAHPDFAPLYADAKITTCAVGTVIYTTAATPAAILAWTRDQAGKSGLKIDLATDMNLSATEGSRNLMVMAMPEGTGSQVTVNWKN